MDDDEDMKSEKKRRSMWRVGAVWVITALCAVVSGAWVLGGWWYWFDLAAGYAAQFVGLTVLVGIGCFVIRHWRAGAVCVLFAGVGLWPVVDGRSLFVESSQIGADEVLIGSFNLYPRNTEWDADLQALMLLDLDVLILQEIPPELNRQVWNHDYLVGSSMPNWVHRAWVEEQVSTGLILSKYRLELIVPEADDGFAPHQLLCVVHHPGQKFVVGLMHPASPRTVERWEEGNRVVLAHDRQISGVRATSGLPVIVGADLNSGPAQLRARWMRGFGLYASKPLLPIQSGSFPVRWVGVAQIQIDDLWRTPDVRVVSWGMLRALGSDHKPVIARFEFD